MARRLIVIAATDLLLKPFDLARKELDRTATIRANHMMVATPVVLMFVAGDAIMKGDFAGQATLGQQLECAVNSRVTDPGVFFLDQPMQLSRDARAFPETFAGSCRVAPSASSQHVSDAGARCLEPRAPFRARSKAGHRCVSGACGVRRAGKLRISSAILKTKSAGRGLNPT
jgi:hypothetical protein